MLNIFGKGKKTGITPKALQNFSENVSFALPDRNTYCRRGECWKGYNHIVITGIAGGVAHMFNPFGERAVFKLLKLRLILYLCAPQKFIWIYGLTHLFQSLPRIYYLYCFSPAKCVLAKKWKSPTLPTIKEWYMKNWDLAVADNLSEGMLYLDNVNTKINFL